MGECYYLLFQIYLIRLTLKKKNYLVQWASLGLVYIYKSRDIMRESMRFCHVAHSMKRIEILLSHIRDKNKFKSEDSLFPLVQCHKSIYIYKSRDLMRESIRFCHVAHSMKRIEIPLSYIRDKNKFKSGDSLFPLVQCFKTNFCYILYSMF